MKNTDKDFDPRYFSIGFNYPGPFMSIGMDDSPRNKLASQRCALVGSMTQEALKMLGLLVRHEYAFADGTYYHRAMTTAKCPDLDEKQLREKLEALLNGFSISLNAESIRTEDPNAKVSPWNSEDTETVAQSWTKHIEDFIKNEDS